MKNTLLFLMGESAAGKDYFFDNNLSDAFHKLLVTTTRPLREGEVNGINRKSVDEKYFFDNRDEFASWSWVNEFDWKHGMPKWMYGVEGAEVLANLGKNLAYDVIQPRYARMMIDWFCANGLDKKYDFKTMWFAHPKDNLDTAAKRANMPNDLTVRAHNTCTIDDFLDVNLYPDFILRTYRDSLGGAKIDPRFVRFIKKLKQK